MPRPRSVYPWQEQLRAELAAEKAVRENEAARAAATIEEMKQEIQRLQDSACAPGDWMLFEGLGGVPFVAEVNMVLVGTCGGLQGRNQTPYTSTCKPR